MKTAIMILMFVQHYLLMVPIQDSIVSGNYESFKNVCMDKVAVNMESPIKLRGNFKKEKFIKDLSFQMNRFKVVELEWISKHIWENFAVQSLNLKLKNLKNGKYEFYKLIFFMKRDQKEWELYYLRGIKL